MKHDPALVQKIKSEETAMRDFALGSIRSAICRIDEIRQEMINAGLALKANYITPQAALEWCNEFAPGCIGHLPYGSGLADQSKRGEAQPK